MGGSHCLAERARQTVGLRADGHSSDTPPLSLCYLNAISVIAVCYCLAS